MPNPPRGHAPAPLLNRPLSRAAAGRGSYDVNVEDPANREPDRAEHQHFNDMRIGRYLIDDECYPTRKKAA